MEATESEIREREGGQHVEIPVQVAAPGHHHPASCPFCFRGFKEKKYLTRHIKEKHPTMTINPYEEQKCDHPDCHYTTRSTACWLSHQRTHRQGRQGRVEEAEEREHAKYVCNVCDCHFSSRVRLESHRARRHQPELLSHACPECGARFRYRGGLNRHLKNSHPTGKDAEVEGRRCPKCFRTFKSKAILSNHVKRIRCTQVKYREALKHNKAKRRRGVQLSCYWCAGGSGGRGVGVAPAFASVVELRRHWRERHGLMDDSQAMSGNRTGDEAAAAAMMAMEVVAKVVQRRAGGQEVAGSAIRVGQPCPRCNRRVNVMDWQHFSTCENSSPSRPEPTHLMFAGHLSLSTRTPELPAEPIPDPCAECGHDRALLSRRQHECALWRREAAAHRTRCFLLLPCPEQELLRSDGGMVGARDLRRLTGLALQGVREGREEDGGRRFSLLCVRERNEKFSTD